MATSTARCAFVAAHASVLGTSTFSPRVCTTRTTPRRARRAAPVVALDPSFVHHTGHFNLAAASHLLATAAAAVADSADAVAGAAGAAAEVAVEVKKSGPIASLAHVIEYALGSLHGFLRSSGVPGAYGVSIILFTVVTKLLTFPLNYKQMESTMKMQALSPRLKAIQTEYKDNPSVVNQMTAKLYKDEQINPLLGCFPILAQLPIWIALYRALQNMAKDDLLNEAFLWIPSLQGPVSQTGQGLNTWLFPLVNGAPPAGWHDALAYLVLPVLLVASQIYSASLMAPPSTDPSAKQANTFNKFIPVLVGWFVLNVPAALGVYMLTNNIVSTGQTLIVRKQLGYGAPPGEGQQAVDPPMTTAASATPPDGFQSNGAVSNKVDDSTAVPAVRKGKGKSGKSGKAKRRKRR